MLSLALAIPHTEPSTGAADPVERFHQQVLAELTLAELERQLQRLLGLIPPPAPPRPWRARRVRRARARRASGGYPAL
jgi:ParB family transcriptional regulator, chromosome partitioning protein